MARAWGVRPTEFLNEWSTQDRELAVALFLAERGDCPGCGHPKSQTWVEDADDDYIAEEVRCLACAALESERAGTKSEKGLHYYVVKRPKGSHAHEATVAEN